MPGKIILFLSLWTVFSMQDSQQLNYNVAVQNQQQNQLAAQNQQQNNPYPLQINYAAFQNQQQHPLAFYVNAFSKAVEFWSFEHNNSALYSLVMKFLACLVLQTIWSYFIDISSLAGIQWLLASIGFLAFLRVLSDHSVYVTLKRKMTGNGALNTSILFLSTTMEKIWTLPQKGFTKMAQKISQLSQNMSNKVKSLLLFANVALFLSIYLATKDALFFKLAFAWFIYLFFYLRFYVRYGLTLAKIMQLPSNSYFPVRTLKTGILLYVVHLSSYWLAGSIVSWPQMLLYVSPLFTLGVHHHLVAVGETPNANSRIRKVLPASIFDVSFNSKIQKTYKYFTNFGVNSSIEPFLLPWLFYFPPFPFGCTTILLVIQIFLIFKLRFLLGFDQ